MKSVSSIVVSLACAATLLSSALPANAADKALATVNGKPVTQQMYDAYAEARTRGGAPATGTEEEKKQVLDEVINLEIFKQIAEKDGLDKKPDVIAQLALQRSRLLANMLIGDYLEKNPISDEKIKAEYDNAIKDGAGKEYKARHILVKTEQEAKDVIKELGAGKNFADIATAKSIDTASKGGDLGWFPPEQMVKPFADALATMKKGDISKTPVQTQFGWHVIEMQDTRSATPPPYDQVKPQIQQKLARDLVEGYVAKARAGAKIEK